MGMIFFLTSGLMKAGRGQKHLSEAKICMKESIYGKKVFNESFSATSKTTWQIQSDLSYELRQERYSDLRGHSMYIPSTYKDLNY